MCFNNQCRTQDEDNGILQGQEHTLVHCCCSEVTGDQNICPMQGERYCRTHAVTKRMKPVANDDKNDQTKGDQDWACHFCMPIVIVLKKGGVKKRYYLFQEVSKASQQHETRDSKPSSRFGEF